jgi:hypothetical protein
MTKINKSIDEAHRPFFQVLVQSRKKEDIMTLPHLGVFSKTLEKSSQWIQDVMDELDWEDPSSGYRAVN